MMNRFPVDARVLLGFACNCFFLHLVTLLGAHLPNFDPLAAAINHTGCILFMISSRTFCGGSLVNWFDWDQEPWKQNSLSSKTKTKTEEFGGSACTTRFGNALELKPHRNLTQLGQSGSEISCHRTPAWENRLRHFDWLSALLSPFPFTAAQMDLSLICSCQSELMRKRCFPWLWCMG